MTKFLKRGHHSVIAELWSLDVQTYKSSIYPNLQNVIAKHLKVFEDIPKGLPPPQDHDHDIHLILGSGTSNIKLYRYRYGQKSQIEHMVEEMFEAGIIRPRQSFYSTLVVMVHKEEGSWHTFLDYKYLHKIIIKEKFTILVITELLDELHVAVYFTKLDLHLG